MEFLTLADELLHLLLLAGLIYAVFLGMVHGIRVLFDKIAPDESNP
jgi:hypothetical protein